MRMLGRFILIFVGLFFLLGCSHKYFEKVQVMTADEHNAAYFVKKLQEQHVEVIVRKSKGNSSEMSIFISAEDVFNEGSANFNPKAYVILNYVRDICRFYEEEVIKVESGENSLISPGLALNRADKVVGYLGEERLGAKFLYADQSKHIQDGRIKISFQKYRRTGQM